MNNDNNDQKIRQKLKELDAVFPSELGNAEELWTQIEERKKARKFRHRNWKVVAIAASVLCVLILAIFLRKTSLPEETIVYSMEEMSETEEERDLYENQEEKEAIAYLTKQCVLEQPVCNTEEFVSLKKQLEETDKQIVQLNNEMSLFGANPALIRARIAIENQRTYLLKELIQIVHS